MTNNEQANIKVTLNTQEAQRELERLQGEMKRLIALKKKAEEAGDVEGYKRIDKEVKKVTRETNKLIREHRDLDKILKDLSGASIEELRQAQRALTAQTSKLNRNTDEYVKKKAQLKLVRNELKKVNAEYRQQQSFISRASGAFNKYFGMITAGLASIAGLSMTIRSAIKDFTQFDDKLADVMKTTGLNKDQVKDLNTELEKIDTRTSQEQLLNLARVAGKLGITGEEEILGFVRAADQISVALGEDLGGAEDAVRELGKLTDIFNLKDLYGQEEALLKIGSSINELGMASTANEAYLVEFSKRTAGIAPQAGVSVQNILGIAATLDALGQKAEMSSTAYSKLMTTMTKKTDEFANIAGMGIREFSQLMEEDANEAMIRVFEGINKNEGGFQQLVSTLGDLGIEGQRMTSVFGALANNTDMLREQQNLSNKAFEEGISLTNEFDIKNNTAQANLEKAIKNFAQMRRELGEKLTPAYTSVISKSKLLLQFISALVDIVSKYGRVIIISTSAIIAYTIAVKLAARWDNIHYGFLVAQNAAKKTAALLTGVLTGKIKLATIAQKAWNLVQKANPIGLLAGLISGAIVAIIAYSKKVNSLTAAQKSLNEVEKTAKQNIVEQKLEIENLLRTAKNEKLSLDQRKAALEELNKISPEYFGNLTLEKINTEEAEEATRNYTNALLEQARVEAAKQKLIELEKERIEVITEGTDSQLSFFEKIKKGYTVAGATVDLFGKRESTLRKEQKWGAEKANQAAANYNKTKEALIGLINKETQAIKKQKSEITEEDDIINTEPVNQETEPFEQITAALEKAYKERQLIITQQYADHELSDKQYKARLWAAEISFLEQKKTLLEQSGQETIEVELQLINKRIDQLRLAADELLEMRQEIQEMFDKDMLSDESLEENALTRSINESIEAGNKAVDEMKKNQSEEGKIMEEKGRMYLDMAESVGNSFQDLLLAQEGSFDQFLKNTLVLALDALEKFLLMSIAETVMRDISSKGLAGIATAAAKIIIMKAAFATAKAGILSIGGKKEGYIEGGYTGPGAKDEIAGFVHRKEYVIPKEGTENPALRPVIDIMEIARRSGSLRKLDLTPIMRTYPVRQYINGGYAGGQPSMTSQNAIQQPISQPVLDIDKFDKAVDKLMQWEPELVITDIKKRLARLERIDQQSKL